MTSTKNKISNMTEDERKAFRYGYRKGFSKCLALVLHFIKTYGIKVACIDMLSDLKKFILENKPKK